MRNTAKLENLQARLINDALNMSDEETLEELTTSYHNLPEIENKLSSRLQATITQARKSLLKKARKEMNTASSSNKSTSFVDQLKKSGKDAKDIFIELMTQGLIPNDLTLAFREGKDLSDSEIEDLLENLLELGILDDNGKEDSK